MDFSIIVTTFNPNYIKLFRTLKSILFQENVTFEIIITDDGSKNFNKKKIDSWFKEKKFTDYKILHSKENEGTTCNVWRGLKNAKGKFTKLISPGDYLYDENVLVNAKKYMQENNYDIIFGKAVYYSIVNNEIVIQNMHNPLNLKPYINYNIKKIKYNNLFYKDLILGAAFICNTELQKKYISKIVNIVKYNEDLCYLLMLEDNIIINFWDEYMIWYENGTGVSHSKKFEKLLYDDKKKFFNIFKDDYFEFKRIYYTFYGKYNKFHIISKYRRKIKMYLLRKKVSKKKIYVDIKKLRKLGDN